MLGPNVGCLPWCSCEQGCRLHGKMIDLLQVSIGECNSCKTSYAKNLPRTCIYTIWILIVEQSFACRKARGWKERRRCNAMQCNAMQCDAMRLERRNNRPLPQNPNRLLSFRKIPNPFHDRTPVDSNHRVVSADAAAAAAAAVFWQGMAGHSGSAEARS